MIFVAAPTGAGKDTLVRKLTSQNPDKNYVVLNFVLGCNCILVCFLFLKQKETEFSVSF